MAKFRVRVRYVAPVAIAALSLGAASVTPSLTSAQTPSLPPTSSAQLVGEIIGATPQSFEGTLVVKANLIGSAASLISSPMPALVAPNGTTSLNIWYGLGRNVRIQYLQPKGEQDIYSYGKDTWIWNSQSQIAKHLLNSVGSSTSRGKLFSTMDPELLALNLIRSASTYTQLSLGQNTFVAGGASYDLVVASKQTGSLFGHADIFVNQKYDQVVGVNIYTKSNQLALGVEFTKLSFVPTSPSLFAFTPPHTAKVESVTTSPLDQQQISPKTWAMAVDSLLGGGTTHIGQGWEKVFVSSPGAWTKVEDLLQKQGKLDPAIISKLVTPISSPQGPAGLISTPMLNLLVLSNGTVLLGSVSSDVLVADASLLGS